MNKSSQLTPDQRTNFLLRNILGGLAVGGGAATVVNLLHAIRDARQDKAQEDKYLKPDENTLVLTLPSKMGAVKYKANKINNAVKEYSKTYKRQLRDNGKFDKGIKKAQQKSTVVNPQAYDILMATLLASGGGIGGYAMGNYIYDKYRKHKLENEIEKAKQEYLDRLMSSTSKTAEAIDAKVDITPVLDYLNMEKSAQQTSFQPTVIDTALASTLLFLLAGAGGSAYLVKKVLDSKLRNTMEDKDTWNIPAVKRIVFKTAPSSHPALQPHSIQPKKKRKKTNLDEALLGTDDTDITDDNLLKASMAIIIDELNGKQLLTNNSRISELVKESGVTSDDLYKWAADGTSSPDALKAYLSNNPELSRELVSAGFKENIPYLGNVLSFLTPNKIKDMIANKSISNMGSDKEPGMISKHVKLPSKFISQELDKNKEFRDAVLQHGADKGGYGTAYSIMRKIPGLGYGGSLLGKELAKVEINRKGPNPPSESAPVPKYKGYGNIDLKRIHPDIPGSWTQLEGIKKSGQIDVGLVSSLLEPPDYVISAPSEQAPATNKLLKAKEDAEYLASKIRVAARDPNAQAYIDKNQSRIMEAISRALEDTILESRQKV